MLPAGITAKINALIDKEMIEKLYEASQAGVKIRLLIRGINGLRSQVSGLSENIEIMSIVGRYLEHHRIYIFTSGGGKKVFLSSADWMPRNLDRRVETLFPIEQVNNKKRILEAMDLLLSDNVKMRIQQSDGTYKRAPHKGKKINSQDEFFKIVKKAVNRDIKAADVMFTPKTRIE